MKTRYVSSHVGIALMVAATTILIFFHHLSMQIQ